VPVLSVARLDFEISGEPNRLAFHDAGQASARLTPEAVCRGLFVHQMAGILPGKAREIFGIPEGHDVVAGIAAGYWGDPRTLPEDLEKREVAPSPRKPIGSFVFSRRWGESAIITKP